MAQDGFNRTGFWDGMRTGAANLGAYLGGFSNPAIRIGVTGLSRAGKTVFITSLAHQLVTRARMPAFRASAEGRIAGARLVEHPDDALPRFAYEDHLATLTGPDRDWPQSTRQISALSIALQFQSRASWLGGLVGPGGLISTGESALRLDIVDYPGEWLLDLPLLGKSFTTWSAETLGKAVLGRREPCFRDFLRMLDATDLAGAAEEGAVQALARAFTAALRACREEGRGLSALAPGRFLLPGDLEGAPALTFVPIPAEASATAWHALMEKRYEAYKARIVRPFFADHFQRMDRQIVLVDVLGALNGGEEALSDLETALTDVLTAFNTGANSLLAQIFAPRVTRVLFAATKADHLHHSNHERLEAILALLVRRAWHRAEAAGAQTETLALAALRATREVVATVKGEDLACVAGVPMRGETLDGRRFDGEAEVALFPGDLPEQAEAVLGKGAPNLSFLRFRPPLIPPGKGAVLPSIRLDAAIEFLIGDALA